MGTANARVESRRTSATAPPAIRVPLEALVRAVVSAWRWLMSERWILELLAIALALSLVVAAAVCGLAVVSSWAPSSQSLAAVQSMRTIHGAEARTGESNRCEEDIR